MMMMMMWMRFDERLVRLLRLVANGTYPLRSISSARLGLLSQGLPTLCSLSSSLSFTFGGVLSFRLGLSPLFSSQAELSFFVFVRGPSQEEFSPFRPKRSPLFSRLAKFFPLLFRLSSSSAVEFLSTVFVLHLDEDCRGKLWSPTESTKSPGNCSLRYLYLWAVPILDNREVFCGQCRGAITRFFFVDISVISGPMWAQFLALERQE